MLSPVQRLRDADSAGEVIRVKIRRDAVAAAFGGIAFAAGAVHAGTKAIQAYNTGTR